jgi:2-keto-4-pentenoate hydratase
MEHHDSAVAAEPASAELLLQAADRLRNAAMTGQPCLPVRDLLGSSDIAAAYRVQAINVGRRLDTGLRVVGRKIGLTSPAVQKQLGVGQPDFGSLLDDMAVAASGVAPIHRLLQPKVEAEVAFWLDADLDGALESVDEVRAAVSGASAAIEIVDSRIDRWDISIVDTVSDNASSGMFVVSDHRVPLADFEPVDVVMSMASNGQEVSSGTGAASLGDPLIALLWLARTARDVGAPLRAGEVVLSGALGPMVSVAPGDRITATLSTLGVVEVAFSSGDE